MERSEFNPFKRAAEYGPDRETARERMFETLERKVEAVRSLKKLMDSFTPESAPEEVQAGLIAQLEETKKGFSAETLRKAEEARRLIIEFNATQEEAGDDDDAAAEKRMDRQQELFELIAELESNEDVRFINDWEGLTGSLIKKNRTVHELGKDPAKALSGFSAHRKRPIAPENVERVVFNAFDVGFMLKPGAYDELRGSPDSVGEYSTGTPFYMAKAGRKQAETENTIRHERTHNVVDGVREIKGGTEYPSSKMPQRLELHDRTKTFGIDVATENSRELLFRGGARRLIDGQHDEILAELERAETRNFSASGDPGADSSLRWRFQDAAKVFSTAGKEVRFARDFYRDLAKRPGEEAMKERSLAAAEAVEREFLRVTGHLKDSMAAGRRIGQDAWEEVHALAALLPPSRYRHMRRYLEHKYSKETVERAILIGSSFEGPPNAEAMAFALADDPMVTDEDRSRLAGRIKNFDFSSFGELGVTTPEECAAYTENLSRLAARVGDPASLKDAASSVWAHFAFGAMERDVENGLAGIPDVLARLPKERQENFKEDILNYIGNFLIDDLETRTGFAFDPDDPESLTTLPHWEVIARLGLEERAREALGIR